MKLSDLLDNYKPKSKANSERAALIEQFVEELRKEQPIEARFVAVKLAHVSTQDLYRFLSTCKDYKARNQSFRKCFFGALK